MRVVVVLVGVTVVLVLSSAAGAGPPHCPATRPHCNGHLGVYEAAHALTAYVFKKLESRRADFKGSIEHAGAFAVR
jgi:hypothetical protein